MEKNEGKGKERKESNKGKGKRRKGEEESKAGWKRKREIQKNVQERGEVIDRSFIIELATTNAPKVHEKPPQSQSVHDGLFCTLKKAGMETLLNPLQGHEALIQELAESGRFFNSSVGLPVI